MCLHLMKIAFLLITLLDSAYGFSKSCINPDHAPPGQSPEPFELVEIVSEPENNRLHYINLFLSDLDDILGLTRESGSDIQVICPEELFEGEVLLAKSGGIDAVFLGCKDCTVEEGGVVNIRYLHNGALSTYRNLYMNLVRSGNHWELQAAGGEPIYKLTLVARRIFGKVIGISHIAVN